MNKYPDLDPGDRGPAVAIAKSILASQGFNAGTGDLFDEKMKDQVVSFQASHKGPDGKPLKGIGRIGQRTWWALQNPSGEAQRSHLKPVPGQNPVSKLLPALRQKVVETALKLWRKGIREIPDGSNWGDGVSEVLENAGGPRFWCAHFIGHIFLLATGAYLFGKDNGLVMAIVNEARKRGLVREKNSGYIPRPGDLGVTLYRNARGQLKGTGHIWMVIAMGPKRGRGRDYNHLGGNEGNRAHLGIRNTQDESLALWINPWNDDHITPTCCDNLPFQANLSKADEAFASTR